MAHKYHAFMCTQQRPAGHPRGCCHSKGSADIFTHLQQKFFEGQLWEKGVGLASSSCLGACTGGPVMVVYPDGVWYHLDKKEDADEILEKHLLGGQVVERLKMEV